MIHQIPYNISDRTIALFAKGRPWTVPADADTFDRLKRLLIDGPAEGVSESDFADEVVGLANIKAAVELALKGQLVIEGNTILFDGRPLHNVWVDKILKHREVGLPYEPIFNALGDLMRNPTPQAIERLPIFLERVQSGFMPDGRCTAYKSVRDDFRDHHSGTVLYEVGTHVEMDRDRVDANPNATCSTGLHVGALGYIDQHYTTGNLLFVAFWPHDVVAVPTDYQGEKMRVTALDVLDVVDRGFLAEFRSETRHVVHRYGPVEVSRPGTGEEAGGDPEDEMEAPEVDEDEVDEDEERRNAFRTVELGDWVRSVDNEFMEVVRIRALDGTRERLGVRDLEGDIEWWDQDDFVEVVDPPIMALRATEGGEVLLAGHPFMRDGWFVVYELADQRSEEGPDDVYVTIEVHGETFGVKNSFIADVRHKPLPEADGEQIAG